MAILPEFRAGWAPILSIAEKEEQDVTKVAEVKNKGLTLSHIARKM
jgi:hypothetical protein